MDPRRPKARAGRLMRKWCMPDDAQKPNLGLIFEIFNEVGIIEQLSRALLEAQLPKGLIAPHFGVISHLSKRPEGSTPIDMARAFQVPKTSMTHTLQGLEKHGLVTIGPNPADGRSKLVVLTEAGHALRNETYAKLGPDVMKAAAALDLEALAAIKPVLQNLREYLDTARD